MLITHKGHTDTIQVYSVTVMTHVKALQAGHSSQGTSEPITPGFLIKSLSDHYSAPGRLAGYKCQFQRAFRRPGDDPSIFAIELENASSEGFYRYLHIDSVTDGARPIHRWTGGVCTPQTLGKFATEYPIGRHS